MRFQCQECEKLFHYAAKITKNHYSLYDATGQKMIDLPSGQMQAFAIPVTLMPEEVTEIAVCPYCQSKDFTEYTEPAPAQEEIQNVYIYDLTTGPQTELDGLLALGYRIVNRYAKAYHLEKPKALRQTTKEIQP